MSPLYFTRTPHSRQLVQISDLSVHTHARSGQSRLPFTLNKGDLPPGSHKKPKEHRLRGLSEIQIEGQMRFLCGFFGVSEVTTETFCGLLKLNHYRLEELEHPLSGSWLLVGTWYMSIAMAMSHSKLATKNRIEQR